MAYEQKTYRYRNAIEREEYHSGKYGAPGMKREKKKKPTPEQMDKVNQRNKEKLCRRKMRKWFRKEDLFVTLTYAVKERPPDMHTAKDHFRDFAKAVRRKYRKQGYELRWIRNIENGTRNAWHIHVVMNRIPDSDLIVAAAWPHGEVDIKLCYKQGEFRELAAYITKSEKTEPRLKETSYSTSRNLPLPEPEKSVVTRWDTWDEGAVKVPPGFYLDKESYHEGINPVTGFPYREYTLLRIKEKEDEDAARRNLYRDKPKRVRKRNRKNAVHVADKAEKRRGLREKGNHGTG